MDDTGTAEASVGLELTIESPRSSEPISPRREADVMLDLSTPRLEDFDDIGMLADKSDDHLESEVQSSNATGDAESFVAAKDNAKVTEIHGTVTNEIHDTDKKLTHGEFCPVVIEDTGKLHVADSDLMEVPNRNDIHPVVLTTKDKCDKDVTFNDDGQKVHEYTALVTATEGLVILDTVKDSSGSDSDEQYSVTDDAAILEDSKSHQTENHQITPDEVEEIIADDVVPEVGKTMAPEVEHVEINKDNLEEEAAASLENILVMQKVGEASDSDSEFDFDLPTQSTGTVKESTDNTKTSSISGLQAVDPVEEAIVTIPQPAAGVEQSRKHVQQSTAHQPVITDQDKAEADKLPSIHQTAEHVETSNQAIQHHKPVAVIKPIPIDSVVGKSQLADVSGEAVEDERKDHSMSLARAEWDNVTTVQAGYLAKDTAQGIEPAVVETLPMISPGELTQYFYSLDFADVKPSIKTGIERHGLAAFVQFLFGPSKLNRPLHRDRDLIFCIAASPLNNDNVCHMRTLQTIYKCLTGSKFDCPRTGGHWEEVGFQGNDPGTDLRGVGLLGLLNLVYFLKDPKTQSLVSDVYRLSLHPTQNFPFCLMGINMSRVVLQILREGILNKECNRRTDLLGVVTDFYAGLYLQMYQVWKSKGKTIVDSGFVIKDIELQARKNPRGVFRSLDDYRNKRTHVVVAERLSHESGQDNFVNVCDDIG